MAHTQAPIEIMAPVGSFESLDAALKAGAGSVYFGAGALNMRSGAKANFDLPHIETITQKCKQHGVKAYLTINTVIYNNDFEALNALIDAAARAQVDAVVAADFAVINLCHQAGLPVHISTQANISNIEAVKAFAPYANAVVLARELSLAQITQISRQIHQHNITGPSGQTIQVEVFGHGALCMAISGKCFLSQHQAGRSANRGACLQHCRRKYIVTDADNGEELILEGNYIMSPKDLKTIDFMDMIMTSGAKILKIEGRARSPEYVYEVVKCYREAAFAVANGTFGPSKLQDWNTRLASVFNRGFWEGHFMGQKTGQWTLKYGNRATHRRTYIGRGKKYFSRLKVGEFYLETGNLCVGDQVVITGPTTGFLQTTVAEIHVDQTAVSVANKGDLFSIKVPDKIRPTDKLFKIVETNPLLEQEY